MGNQPVNIEVDPHALAHAQALWHTFTLCMTYGVISVAILLIILAALFV